MSEQTAEIEEMEETEERDETEGESPSGSETGSYPDPRAETGEEQQNRLGYMVTEPTEEEIEGEEDEEA